MRNPNLRTALALTLILAFAGLALAPAASAAPPAHPADSAGWLQAAWSGLGDWLTGWLVDAAPPAPERLTAASGHGMDPDGSPTETSGGGMDPDGTLLPTGGGTMDPDG